MQIQIDMLYTVFSLDSVIVTVRLPDQISIMAIAIIDDQSAYARPGYQKTGFQIVAGQLKRMEAIMTLMLRLFQVKSSHILNHC